MNQSPDTGKRGREGRFVQAVIQQCIKDKGTAARTRRADNAATEYQSWDLLAMLGVDLEKDYVRLPFAAIAASIARAKVTDNGSMTLGQAIAACYEEGREASQAKARLRRVLACNDLAEACRILRPVLSLIESKVARPLDYERLLRQLRRFSFEDSRHYVKTEWAQEFYGRPIEGTEAPL